VLVIDSDVPWIPTVSRPADGARIHHIDLDPLKAGMPLWHIPAASVFRADAATALAQLERRLDAAPPDPALVAARAAHWARRHAEREGALAEREAEPAAAITPEYLTAQVRARLDGRSIVLNEGITNYSTVVDHLRPAGREGC
jgi:acetolactate synthase-1/2/3 large subunit